MIQVSGHQHSILFKSEVVLKRADPAQLRFYRTVSTIPQFAPFICNYLGEQAGCLILQNLLFDVDCYSLIDIKPGHSREWTSFSQQKNQRMRLKQIKSGCKLNGFRISGFSIRNEQGTLLHQLKVKGKQYQRFADPSVIKLILFDFFCLGGNLHKTWLLQAISILQAFQRFLHNDNKYRFASTSILFLIDHQQGRLKFRWIDFKYYKESDQGDPNLLEGVRALKRFISQLID